VWLLSLVTPLLLLCTVDVAFLQLAEGERFTGYHRRDFLYYSANGAWEQ
jgi:hypothetical protein